MHRDQQWFSEDTEQDDILLDVGEEIFQYISDKVTTYPQEISMELGHSLRTVQYHLRRMFNEQRIGILHTPFRRPPDRILFRLGELHAQKMSGMDIRKYKWYCVYETGEQLRERLNIYNGSPIRYNHDQLCLFLR